MMGISNIYSRLLLIFFWVATLTYPTTALSTVSDLLSGEEWALDSYSVIVTQQSGTQEARGTCATTPVITGNSYTCSSYTLPAVEDTDINIHQAWDYINSTQEEVVIALIDTGIDYLHPDLKDKVWLNPGEALYIDGNNNGIDDGCEDGIDLDNNGYLDDCHGINTIVDRYQDSEQTILNPLAGDPIDSETGHGTNMAGVMGAVGNNASKNFHGGIVGVTGLNSNIRIATCAAAQLYFDVYVTIPNLGGAYGTREDILECFDYFSDLKDRGVNIVVVNGSGGASLFNNLFNILIPEGKVREKYLLDTPEVDQAISRLAAQDINLVVAAGNNGWDIDRNEKYAYYPAAFNHDNIIAVGAINNQGETWDRSSYGRWSVDVFAPGERILSTTPRYEITNNVDNQDYIVSDGTSQATAFVTGMIAMARTHADTAHLSASDLRRLMISTGKILPGLEDKSVSGKLARLFDANNAGFLNCDNQHFKRRHWPQQNEIQKLPGEWVRVEVVNYNCHNPGTEAALTATIQPSGETFTLYDDGVFPDIQANDGIYTGEWQAQSEFDLYEISWGVDTTTNQVDTIKVHTTIIVDNADSNTSRVGSWWYSIFRPGSYKGNYRYAYESGERIFTWTPEVTQAGFYEVYAHWPIYSGFTQHAEYTIHHGNPDNPNAALVAMNQSQNGGQWNYVGTYWFDTGEFNIELSNQDITGAVIADAIKLRPVNE